MRVLFLGMKTPTKTHSLCSFHFRAYNLIKTSFNYHQTSILISLSLCQLGWPEAFQLTQLWVVQSSVIQAQIVRLFETIVRFIPLFAAFSSSSRFLDRFIESHRQFWKSILKSSLVGLAIEDKLFLIELLCLHCRFHLILWCRLREHRKDGIEPWVWFLVEVSSFTILLSLRLCLTWP